MDEIVEVLGFFCLNVSIGLKELEFWKFVWLLYKLGDCCEYFFVLDDIWIIFCILVEE